MDLRTSAACIIALFGTAGVGAGASAAVVVVNYDTDTNGYTGGGGLTTRSVTQNVDLDGDTANDDSYVTRGFTDVGGTPWSNQASYTGPTLYGGARGESINVANANFNDYDLSYFDLRYQTNTSAVSQTGRLHAALVFAASQTAAGFDAASSIRISGNTGGSLAKFDNLGDVRFLVRAADGTYYVSQSTIANTVDGRELDGAELATEMWAVYTPSTSLNFADESASFSTTTAALGPMNAFGVIVDKDDFTGVRHWLSFNEFQVTAVVPEPASLALAGLGMMGLMRRRRR